MENILILEKSREKFQHFGHFLKSQTTKTCGILEFSTICDTSSYDQWAFFADHFVSQINVINVSISLNFFLTEQTD